MSRSPGDAPESADRPVTVREVEAKSITRIPGFTDPWFLGRYGMNLYRGCQHGCLYCDGRAERYYVEGDFAHDVVVKTNALEILDKELGRVREPGFVFFGGGVSDAYQPLESKYELARGALGLAERHRLPVHVLTKSALVERDLDLLERVAERSGAVLSFSIQTLDEEVRRRFEPEAAPMEERWRLLREARRRGLGTGVMAMPVLPGISDTPEAIDALVGEAREADVDFLCFGGLTLRPGAQMETYLAAIRRHRPQHLEGYHRLYRSQRPSGAGDGRYYARVDARFHDALRRHGLPARMPRRLFSARIPAYAEVAILLEHHELAERLAGREPPSLGRAGFAIQTWARGRFAAKRSRKFTWRHVEAELRGMAGDGSLAELPGMTVAALRLVREWL